jgi:hypothetical protein
VLLQVCLSVLEGLQDAALTARYLTVLAQLIDWIDVTLVVNDRFVRFAFDGRGWVES